MIIEGTVSAVALEGTKATALEIGKNIEAITSQFEKLLSSSDAQSTYEGMNLKEMPGKLEQMQSNELSPLERPMVELKSETGQKIAEVPPAEKELYDNAGLEAKEINGKDVLIRDDIDLAAVDARGRTNLERMEKGLAPIDSTGKEIELHHIRQEADGPLAELTHAEHHGNFELLHPHLNAESTIDRGEFAKIRAEHWQTRAEMMKAGA